jgi:hypothetical protein
VLAPLLLHLYTREWRNIRMVMLTVGFFGTALVFRSLDHHPLMTWMPMGTHWLWHLMGGLAVHFLMTYIHRDDLHGVSTRRAAATFGRELLLRREQALP